MYRKEIKLLDATIRDGGLINNHKFEHRFVREVYKSVSAAGVDYIEQGYKNFDKIINDNPNDVWNYDESTEKKIIEIENELLFFFAQIVKTLDISIDLDELIG